MADYNRTTASTISGVNAELQKVATAIASKVDETGGSLLSAMNANGQRILNLPIPVSSGEPVPFGMAIGILDQAQAAADRAEDEADRSQAQADRATSEANRAESYADDFQVSLQPAKDQALLDIAADVAAVDASRVSAQSLISADVAQTDASRINAQDQMAVIVGDVVDARNDAQSVIDANVSNVRAIADYAAYVEIPAQVNRLGLQYPPIPYSAGLLLDSHTKTYSKDGFLYIWAGLLGTTSNGLFTETGWQPLQGDVQLRQDVEQGTPIIRDVKHVASVSALNLLPGKYVGQVVILKSEDGVKNAGGGSLYFQTATPSGSLGQDYFTAPNGFWARIASRVFESSFPSDISQVGLNQRLVTRPIDVISRPPTRKDNVGYVDGSVWQFNRRFWVAARTVQGARVGWVKNNDPLSEAGRVAPNAEAVWWLERVVPAYAGPCLNVTNAALGTSIDIGFDANGKLDVSTLDAFLVGTKGLVNTWYDQTGNGHSLTSAGANRPVITTTDTLNGLRSVVFERSVIYNGVTVPEQFMQIPSTVTGSSNSVSIAALGRFSHAVRDTPIVQLNQAGGYTSLGKRNQTGLDSIVLYQNNSPRVVSQVQPSSNPNFVAATLSSGAPGQAVIYSGDVPSATGTSLGGVTFTGGKVGGSDGLFVDGVGAAQNGGVLLSGLIVWKRALSLLEYRNLYRVVARDFDLAPQVKGRVVCDGDSITEGAFATYFNNWPRLMEDLLQYRSNVYLTASSGGTVVTQIANKTKWLSRIYDPTSPYNVVIAFMGTNDLAAGAAAAVVWGNLVSYISDVKSAGFDVIVCTCLPRAAFLSTAKEAERLEYNTLIRNNWKALGCSYLVDFDLDGTMGRADLTSNTSFYVDGTHPTQLGLNLIATYVTETVDEYVSSKLLEA